MTPHRISYHIISSHAVTPHGESTAWHSAARQIIPQILLYALWWHAVPKSGRPAWGGPARVDRGPTRGRYTDPMTAAHGEALAKHEAGVRAAREAGTAIRRQTDATTGTRETPASCMDHSCFRRWHRD